MPVKKWSDIRTQRFSPEELRQINEEIESELLEMDLRALREAVGLTQGNADQDPHHPGKTAPAGFPSPGEVDGVVGREAGVRVFGRGPSAGRGGRSPTNGWQDRGVFMASPGPLSPIVRVG